ncbi:hypothetical protein M8994_23180, partial [Brucella sp. 21LCYQ03]|nr:hypothetical protein [Brucella sp. 21LCYQ03]
MKNNFLPMILLVGSIALSGCTRLEEQLFGQITDRDEGNIDIPSLLQGAYFSTRAALQTPESWWALQELTTDEAIAPTRGGDWDDNGAWRALFLHLWQPDHIRMNQVFRDINA